MKEPNKPELKTRAGLNYFRQERDEKKLTDRQLLDLYDKIEEIEDDITRPSDRKWIGVPQGARAPFDKLPCHRDIAVEIQGEKWVTEKEWALGIITAKENSERRREEEEARILKEYKINSLRNL
ncbi:MAG: hypothetical protein CMA57_00455 [Euryarchaeota archaeon]|nr:hypothetical protein [Euryarchaeota archaeon]